MGRSAIAIPSHISQPPPLVGREGELAALRAHLDAAIEGHGSLVLIGGEAGIGKTTLAEAVCQEATQRGVLVLVGRCYDLTETPPYGPWVELFGHYRTADGRPPLPAVFAQPGLLGPITSRATFFQQVLDFLTALATARPVGARPLVLLLDDLHWSDPESLDLLRVVARALASVPILVVVTYRLDELTRRHPLSQLLPMLVREASAARIDLRRIEAADIHALIDARYALPGRDAGRLAAYLDDRSGGNPFFLSELLRTLEAERILRPSTAGWSLGDLTEIRVPPLLRQVIDARLARLESEVQRLLATASVIGQEVSLALWATVAESDEQTLSMAVEQAMEAHLMVASRDGARVQFAHALIREAL
jgi:predicted ATPase